MLLVAVHVAAASVAHAEPGGAHATPGRAVETASPRPAPTTPRGPRVRLGLSRAADVRLAELRVRRLLAIELGRKVSLERESTGPLDDDLVQLWVDLVEGQVSLQVRKMGRSLAQRVVELGNYPADVAAQMVVLEASEMIRVQIKATPPDPCAGCNRAPAPEPDELAATSLAAGLATRWMPATGRGPLVGSRLELGHAHGRLRQTIGVEWLGTTESAPARWVGGTLGLDVVLPWPGPASRARLAAGVRAAASAVRSEGATPVDDWTASLSGRLGCDVLVSRGTWVGLGVEPGAVLRPVDPLLRGFGLGAVLSIGAGPTR